MRIHSFEFGDLTSVPKFYHNYLRTLMSLLYDILKIHTLWIPIIEKFYKESNSNQVMDPCAGSGHVNYLIQERLKNDNFSFVLSDFMTDKAPSFSKKINQLNNPKLKYIEHSVDVLSLDNKLELPKIFINSFHHFTPEQVGIILEAHAKKKTNILILEYCRKSFLNFISMILGPLIGALLFPFIVKRKDFLPSFVFVFIIPIIPLMLLWDGIISSLRTYNSHQIHKILIEKNIEDFKIETYQKRSLLYPSGVTGLKITF